MSQAQPTNPATAPDVVNVVIKNPLRTTTEDFKIQLSLSCSVSEVKQSLQERYPGNPSAARQTLIYSGKVLKDDKARLKDILKQEYNPDVPYTLHLVVKTDVPPPPARPAPVSKPAEAVPSSSGTEAESHNQPAPNPFRQYMQQFPLGPNPFFTEAPAPGTSADASSLPQGYSYPAYPNPYLYCSPALAAMYNAAYATLRCANPSQSTGTSAGEVSAAPPPMLAYFPIVAPQPALVLPVSLLHYGPTQQPPDQERQALQFAPLPLAAHVPYGLVPGNPYNAQFVAAAGMPAAGLGQPGQPQELPRRPVIRVRMFRINTSTILKYLFAFYLIYQYCPPQRFLLLVLGGFLLYLTTLTPLRRFLHRLVGVHNQDNNENGVRRPALLREIQALIMGFFTSLLPGWNYNPEDAAAFAAAQEVVAREAVQEGQQNDAAAGGAAPDAQQPAQQDAQQPAEAQQ